MSLSSQSARIGIARGGASRRRRRFGRLPQLIVLIAVVAVVTYFLWPSTVGDSDDVAGRTPQGGEATGVNPNGESTSGGTSGGPATVSLGLGDEPGGADATPSLTLGNPPPQPAPPVTGTRQLETETPSAPPAVNTRQPDPQPAKPAANPAPTAEGDPAGAGTSGGGGNSGGAVSDAIQRTREAVPPPHAVRSSADAMTLYNQADRKLADGDLVGGRALLSRLLFSPDLNLSADDATVIRNRLTEVNQKLVFSSEVYANDPLAERHQVQSGEYLASIGVKYKVPYQLLEIVNNMKAKNLQADRPIKVIRGPIHARVIKSQFLMDLYAYGSDGLPVYLCSFRVGLGQEDKTPVGQWALTKGEKVINPDWRDDLTNEYYPSNDPKNPIGEYWMAIHGTDQNTKTKTGFGIHGTIEPDSIGTMASRGCIRLGNDDIELAFHMLSELGSTVQVVP